ncbi:DUF1799 domain-containing protein [Pseudogulbenkiania sp. NH8B]|uniref:DUF1799 domain-containing protein n=1 Tax=Pseudogulbenkiania sp. (strain NH8B) TaxID=748280 RepID=UPI0021016802|nr:DUF1799 domain-containing protein [Pseudogulbenkiania sp. NH8B]
MYAANASAVRLWLSVAGQWRRAGMTGLPVALDYAAVESVMNMQAIPRRQRGALLNDLRVMERVTLDVWSEQRG